MKNYVCNIVNFFNNLEGKMSPHAIRELVEIVSVNEDKYWSITNEQIRNINTYIENDNCDMVWEIIQECIKEDII